MTPAAFTCSQAITRERTIDAVAVLCCHFPRSIVMDSLPAPCHWSGVKCATKCSITGRLLVVELRGPWTCLILHKMVKRSETVQWVGTTHVRVVCKPYTINGLCSGSIKWINNTSWAEGVLVLFTVTSSSIFNAWDTFQPSISISSFWYFAVHFYSRVWHDSCCSVNKIKCFSGLAWCWCRLKPKQLWSDGKWSLWDKKSRFWFFLISLIWRFITIFFLTIFT